MHGETAAAASFARRLVKEKDAGKPLRKVIEQMNTLVKAYIDNSGRHIARRRALLTKLFP